MKEFGKLNENSTAIGVGAGKELILFYLANDLGHLYATDLYSTKDWENFALVDFAENPSKYSPFPYNQSALSVLRMNGASWNFSRIALMLYFHSLQLNTSVDKTIPVRSQV